MNRSYLEITYRQGKPFAAYLYLDRRGDEKAARTQRHGQFVVDLASDGRVIGIEFTRVGAVDLAELNRVLIAAHHPVVSEADLVPLVAA